MTETDEEEARKRAEITDLQMRGAFVSPFSTVFTILYFVCVLFLLWYLLVQVLPISVTSILSLQGILLGLLLFFISVVLPGIPLIPIFVIPILEYLVFGRSPLDISPVSIAGACALGIYSMVRTTWAINRVAISRGDELFVPFGENPMVKKEIIEQEIGVQSPGFKSLSLISTTSGLIFIFSVTYIIATHPSSRAIPTEIILPVVTLMPLTLTLTSGLRLIYVQKDTSVGAALKWIAIYFGIIIFGYTWIYQNLYPISGSDLCLNIPDYLKSGDMDHAINSLYFSVVTFTTLGYGDIQPLGWCRLVAVSQALCGILFTPLFIAFLFGVISRQVRS